MNKNTHTHIYIYTGPLFPATKSMAAMCIKVVDSSQEVCCPIHPAISSWSKTFHSTASGKHGWFCLCKQASTQARRQESKQAAASNSKQQASSKQEASKQEASSSSSSTAMQAAAEASSSNQPMPPSKNDQIYSNISSKDQRNTRIELFPGARLQHN